MSNKVEDLLEQALLAVSLIDRAATRCQNLVEIADIYLQIGAKSRCLEILSDALNTAELIKQPEEKSRQLVWAGRVFLDSGDNVKAKELFTRAYLLARATETISQQVISLSNLAGEYTEAKLKDGSGQILSELHALVTGSDSEVDIACELISIARLYLTIGNSDQSLKILEEILPGIRDLNDNWFKTERLIDAAEIYSESGSKEDAVRLLKEARTLAGLMEEGNRPFFLLKIADVLMTSGYKAEARGILNDALVIVKKDENSYSKSGDLISISSIFAQLDEGPLATDLLIQAEITIEGIEDLIDRVSRDLEVSWLYLETEQTEKSLEIIRKAKDLIPEIEDPKSRLNLLGELAVLLVEKNLKEQAAEIISGMVHFITQTRTKTSGLGEVALDLVSSGELSLALQLAVVIREPHIKSEVLTGIARILAESNRERGV